jgi:F-type H+-transporting ATPase subunit b
MGLFDGCAGRATALAGAAAVVATLAGAPAALAQAATEHGPAATEHADPLEPGPAGGPGLEGVEEGVEAAEHGGGLPQLDAHTFPSQIFWLIVAFATLYYLLSRRALPRVSDILEARQERIAADLDRAAALRDQAEEALRRHQAVVAEAQAKAAAAIKATQDRIAAEAARRQAEVDADLARKLAEAEARIGAARDAALQQIQGVVVEVAQAAVQRLAGLKIAQKDVKAAVDRVTGEAA